jgi:hypothetical protein
MPPHVPQIFDPLLYLQLAIKCHVYLAEDGPRISFKGYASTQQKERANRCLRMYRGLIQIQLEAGGVSVQKLIGRGVIRLEGGRYVRQWNG